MLQPPLLPHNNEVRYQQISNNHCGLQLLLVPFMNLHSKTAAALLPADSPVAQNQCRKANSGKCNSIFIPVNFM